MVVHKTPAFLKRLFPDFEWQVEGTEKNIYITFDDGPHPVVTPWALDCLNQFDAKATFFMVGENVTKYPNVVNALREQGHQVGNHTYNHMKGWKSIDELYIKNVEECAKVLPTNLFRPPYGRIKISQAEVLKKNYRIVMWTLLSGDYSKSLDTEKALKQLKKYSQPGAIVVFHDSEKAFENLKKILPEYLRYIKENNFTCRCL